jgi:hypothetical protein
MEQAESNARILFSNKYLSADRKGNLKGIASWNFIGRIIFWIKDHLLWNWGKETRKVHEAALKTFAEMKKQMIYDQIFWFRTTKYIKKFKSRKKLYVTYNDLLNKIKKYSIFNNFSEIQDFKLLNLPKEIEHSKRNASKLGPHLFVNTTTHVLTDKDIDFTKNSKYLKSKNIVPQDIQTINRYIFEKIMSTALANSVHNNEKNFSYKF